MANKRLSKPSWGSGRIAFVALLDTIRAEIGQGLTLTVIFNRHQAVLGVRYSAFCKLVARYADDAKPFRPRQTATAKAASPTSILSQRPLPLTAEIQPDARHEPNRRRAFNHDAIERPDDRKRLLGEN